MAKNNTNSAKTTENEVKTEEKATKTAVLKVKMRCGYWGTYGVFKPNDVVELSEKVAKNFI